MSIPNFVVLRDGDGWGVATEYEGHMIFENREPFLTKLLAYRFQRKLQEAWAAAEGAQREYEAQYAYACGYQN